MSEVKKIKLRTKLPESYTIYIRKDETPLRDINHEEDAKKLYEALSCLPNKTVKELLRLFNK